MSGAQWGMRASDFMATLQDCIWGHEAACLQVQSGKWRRPHGSAGLSCACVCPCLCTIPYGGPEAVCWWESGRLWGLPFEGGLGDTLPKQEELQASRPVHTVYAGLNSHQSPLLTFLLLARVGQQRRTSRDSHQECRKVRLGFFCLSLLSQPRSIGLGLGPEGGYE